MLQVLERTKELCRLQFEDGPLDVERAIRRILGKSAQFGITETLSEASLVVLVLFVSLFSLAPLLPFFPPSSPEYAWRFERKLSFRFSLLAETVVAVARPTGSKRRRGVAPRVSESPVVDARSNGKRPLFFFQAWQRRTSALLGLNWR